MGGVIEKYLGEESAMTPATLPIAELVAKTDTTQMNFYDVQRKRLQKFAESFVTENAKPVEELISAGTTEITDDVVKTRRAFQDFRRMQVMNQWYKVSGIKKYQDHVRDMIIDWATINVPTGHPINQTHFEGLHIVLRDLAPNGTQGVFTTHQYNNVVRPWLEAIRDATVAWTFPAEPGGGRLQYGNHFTHGYMNLLMTYQSLGQTTEFNELLNNEIDEHWEFNYPWAKNRIPRDVTGPQKITAASPGSDTITIKGNFSTFFISGAAFDLYGSTGNDGRYEVSSSSYNAGSNDTTVVVTGNIQNPTADGYVTHPFTDLALPNVTAVITDVDTVAKEFTISGDRTGDYTAGRYFNVMSSTNNDKSYTVVGSSFSAGPNETTITVVEEIKDPTVDGNVSQAHGSRVKATPSAQTINSATPAARQVTVEGNFQDLYKRQNLIDISQSVGNDGTHRYIYAAVYDKDTNLTTLNLESDIPDGSPGGLVSIPYHNEDVDYPIRQFIKTIDTGLNKIVIPYDMSRRYPNNTTFEIQNSTSNDGTYTTNGAATYDAVLDETTIIVDQTIPSNNTDGNIVELFSGPTHDMPRPSNAIGESMDNIRRDALHYQHYGLQPWLTIALTDGTGRYKELTDDAFSWMWNFMLDPTNFHTEFENSSDDFDGLRYLGARSEYLQPLTLWLPDEGVRQVMNYYLYRVSIEPTFPFNNGQMALTMRGDRFTTELAYWFRFTLGV